MIFALLTHALFNINSAFSLNKHIQYPLIIAFTPYLISKLPLLGTRNLMVKGIQPLISTAFLLICTIVVQYIVKEMKTIKQTDFLSLYLKDEKKLRVQGFEIKRDFLVVLIIVLLSEFGFQSIVSANEYDKLEKALLRALAKYHEKKT
jgi:hypothetical protein